MPLLERIQKDMVAAMKSKDEARLSALFGDAYREYLARVKRWIPGIF